MNEFNLKTFNNLNSIQQEQELIQINLQLENFTAEQRISWALKYLPQTIVLSSSFGIQSAVSLHLVTKQFPQIPIILIDTGYLFPETYLFIDKLTELLKLNLQIFRSNYSPAWQEARYGKLWEQGIKGIEKYNQINKVQPMQKALTTLKVGTWLAGLRRKQTISRAQLVVLMIQSGIFKFLPIIDWDNKQIYEYLIKYNLPYHPLWHDGYVSVGDIHTTHKIKPGMTEDDARFFGLKRECGLHETN